MKTRGKPWLGVCRLYASFIVLLLGFMGSASILAAENALPKMALYRSALNYSHDYPQTWSFADRSNTDSFWNELIPAGTDSSSLTATYASFVLSQIDSLEIKAAFFENADKQSFVGILVNLGPNIDKINSDALDLLEMRFQNKLLPSDAVVKVLDTSIIRKGLGKTMGLTAITTEPGQTESVHYHSVTVDSKGRSFTFTLRGNEADVQRLKPVLDSMVKSLKDKSEVERGVGKLPLWAEIALIVLFSLMISWLIIRMTGQRKVASRHRRSRGISFFQLFLIVCTILIALSYLLTSCQIRNL